MLSKQRGTGMTRSLVWIAVIAALLSALVTSVATAQTGPASDNESASDTGDERAERIAAAFQTTDTDLPPTTMVDVGSTGQLQIDVKVQGRSLSDLPLVANVHLGYRCAGGATQLLRVWIDDFGLINFDLGSATEDAYAHIRATRSVEPGICGVWIARGAEPGAFVSGTGLYEVVAGETTNVQITGRSGSGFACRGLPATIVGTSDDDVLSGTSGDDVIVADLGDDFVRGRGGDDVICGGAGDDLLWGNTGTDRLFGGAGDDIVRGGRGTDLVLGGAGFDIADGGLDTNSCNAEFVRRCE